MICTLPVSLAGYSLGNLLGKANGVMELATWLSVIVLGPGSIAIFVWFLLDVKRIFRRDDDRPS